MSDSARGKDTVPFAAVLQGFDCLPRDIASSIRQTIADAQAPPSAAGQPLIASIATSSDRLAGIVSLGSPTQLSAKQAGSQGGSTFPSASRAQMQQSAAASS